MATGGTTKGTGGTMTGGTTTARGSRATGGTTTATHDDAARRAMVLPEVQASQKSVRGKRKHKSRTMCKGNTREGTQLKAEITCCRELDQTSPKADYIVSHSHHILNRRI
jgi:hypothetical protein